MIKEVESEDVAHEFLGTSKNGIRITFDPVHSHAATHLEDTPSLRELLAEVIQNMDLDGQEIKAHTDMDRVVGTCDVVDVDEADEIIYAKRKNRDEDGLVPFTKSRPATDCSSVAYHLVPQSDGSYELSSAWIGVFGGDDEPFPQSPDASERSSEFWSTHAFVWGSQEIMPGTETTIKPW